MFTIRILFPQLKYCVLARQIGYNSERYLSGIIVLMNDILLNISILFWLSRNAINRTAFKFKMYRWSRIEEMIKRKRIFVCQSNIRNEIQCLIQYDINNLMIRFHRRSTETVPRGDPRSWFRYLINNRKWCPRWQYNVHVDIAFTRHWNHHFIRHHLADTFGRAIFYAAQWVCQQFNSCRRGLKVPQQWVCIAIVMLFLK